MPSGIQHWMISVSGHQDGDSSRKAYDVVRKTTDVYRLYPIFSDIYPFTMKLTELHLVHITFTIVLFRGSYPSVLLYTKNGIFLHERSIVSSN